VAPGWRSATRWICRLLVEEIAEEAALEGDVREVTLRVESKTSAHVLGSRELLHVAIENVLRNALRHTPHASTVKLELLQAGDQVSLSVYDQGPGVQESDLRRMFEPFFRSEDARSNFPSGSGLGLAMTCRIVEKHGGSVAARNQQTGGLVVKLLFPVGESSITTWHDNFSMRDAAGDALGLEQRSAEDRYYQKP